MVSDRGKWLLSVVTDTRVEQWKPFGLQVPLCLPSHLLHEQSADPCPRGVECQPVTYLILLPLLTLAHFLLLVLHMGPFLINDLPSLPHPNICLWELRIAHACGHQKDSVPAECSPVSVPSGRHSLHSQKFSEPNRNSL